MPIISRLKANEGMNEITQAFDLKKIEEDFLELGVRQKQRTENSSILLIVGLLNIATCCDNMRLLTAVSENKHDMPAHFYFW